MVVVLHLCNRCGEQYESERFQTLYPSTGEQPIKEQLRVLQTSADYTVLRLIRTESQAEPEEWRLLTFRLPEQYCIVGKEFGLTISPRGLEYLKGKRDVP